MEPKEIKEQLEMLKTRLEMATRTKNWDKVASTISEIDRLIRVIDEDY